jgi:hypothetical protein
VKVAHVRLCYSCAGVPARSAGDGVFFKGAARHGIYDNMKAAVDGIFVGRERAYNRRFLVMCGRQPKV